MLSRISRSLLFPLIVLLTGCSAVVLQPSGDVALQQRNLVIASTILMLLIIVPVMVLTAVFAWRYRATNTKADYRPDWHHSTALELVIWSAPLLIIIALGAITWMATHTLDPYRPVSRLSATQPLSSDVKPLKVQVVALDWKWLFIYPDLGIATVNELAAPLDVPIDFQITASSVMNSFFIPALAGQIYAMPAMETQLHAVINKAGQYEGFSANYSGAGFSDMHFRFYGMSAADFAQWLQKVKADGGTLGRDDYLVLERPSERVPVKHYAEVAPGLYDAILNLCVEPNKMCQRDMMKIDAKGGLGMAGIGNIGRLIHDHTLARDGVQNASDAVPQNYVLAQCATDSGVQWSAARVQPLAQANDSKPATAN